MSHIVYRVVYSGLPRDHHTIFVETCEEGAGSGHQFEVSGDIQTGMSFENESIKKPEVAATFVRKEQLGSVTHDRYSHVLTTCQNILPPKQQFQGSSKRLYPEEPLRRCQEWTAEVIQALIDTQILLP